MTDPTPRPDPPSRDRRAGRLLALGVALSVLALALAPQLSLWLARGREWRGAYAYATTDERAYAAYVNALADGRPRRNDPYTGRDDAPGAAQPESLFSIQFVPAYALALLKRASGLRTSAVFFALLCAAALAAPLALFRLIRAQTGDARLAAAGTLFVLCLGTLATGHGVLDGGNIFAGVRFRHMPFLRRYQPCFAFPLFFAFCALAWRTLTRRRTADALRDGLLAGVTFALLVYSYFYLWTAAAAWLAGLAALWLAMRPGERRRTLARLCVIAAPALAALAPYALLLARRSETLDAAQIMELTRTPDPFRLPELLALAPLTLLALAHRRRRFAAGDGRALFAASFALVPFAVFNQQVLTGRSLQPFHYDTFVANYCVLLSLVLAAPLLRARPLGARPLAAAAAAALAWGAFDTAMWTKRSVLSFIIQDNGEVAGLSLARLGAGGGGLDTSSLVFAPTLPVTDLLPTVAPQPVLWAPHMSVFAGPSAAEERERLFQHFYYSGVDLSGARGRDLNELDRRTKYYAFLLLGPARVNPDLSTGWRPVTPDELDRAIRAYSEYSASFDRERAARLPLSYVLVYDYEPFDLTNLDRFYERDAGERTGDFTLYRVRPRP